MGFHYILNPPRRLPCKKDGRQASGWGHSVSLTQFLVINKIRSKDKVCICVNMQLKSSKNPKIKCMHAQTQFRRSVCIHSGRFWFFFAIDESEKCKIF